MGIFDKLKPKPIEKPSNKIDVPDELDESGTNFFKPALEFSLWERIVIFFSGVEDYIIDRIVPVAMKGIMKGVPMYFWLGLLVIVVLTIVALFIIYP